MKILPSLVVLLATSFATVPFAADISGLAWNQSNIATLRSLSKADLLTFLNEQRHQSRIPLPPLTATEIGQFEWADLTGKGRYDLLTTSSYPCVAFVEIDSRDASGRVNTIQTIEGWADLKTSIRDLNGDGGDELILQKPLVKYNCASVATWPAVYRFENEKYVEASRDFPKFYDDEVLPELNAQISRYQAKANDGNSAQEPASLIMKRDKIFRVLGRDPTAGLQQAYQWMNTDDPRLLQDAAATFNDIGGHQEEANAVTAKYTRALCERTPSMVMCRSAAQH